jgi:hypothetical protein
MEDGAVVPEFEGILAQLDLRDISAEPGDGGAFRAQPRF